MTHISREQRLTVGPARTLTIAAIRRFRQWREHREAVRQMRRLDDLDDHLRADIGYPPRNAPHRDRQPVGLDFTVPW